MSETPLLDDTPQEPISEIDAFEDTLSIQDGLQESAAAAERFLNQPEATVGGTIPPELTETIKPRLKITPRGKVVATTAVTLASLGVVGGAVALVVAENAPETPVSTVQVTVTQGDAWQTIIEKNVPDVANGKKSWTEVKATIAHLPQNSEVAKPGHILQPGESISIPVYESEQ